MASKHDSWVKNYEDVDFDIPFPRYPATNRVSLQQERERMLPSLPITHQHTLLNSTPPIFERALSPVRRVKMAHARSSSMGTPSSSQESSAPPSDTPASTATPQDPPTLSRSPRSGSFKSFASSPLNPASPPVFSPFGRPGSRGSAYITRLPSEECRALSAPTSDNGGSQGMRGSMILYRRSDVLDDTLVPPTLPINRGSVYSSSGDSFVSLSSDSKYPSGFATPQRGLVAYAYDPSTDEPELEEDPMHDPALKTIRIGTSHFLCGVYSTLFVLYPVLSFNRDSDRSFLITRNSRINSTGQAIPESFDPRSQVLLSSAIEGRSDDGMEYELVFSDEFELDGRTFYTGRSHAEQVFTRDGHLVLRVIGGLLRSRTPFCLGMDSGGDEWMRAYVSVNRAYPDEASPLSSLMEIDYVRFYQRKTQSRSQSCNSRSASPTDVILQPNSCTLRHSLLFVILV
ncbi:hypothetical protein BDQ17DRAFT_1354999 [Cyathus striatus]|nr:hypothetical protein BDQ17DRAFT_1354999 [Cyathus striatus]